MLGEKVQVPAGIAIELPKGYVALIWDKSSLSQKHGLKTLGGVMDCHYRGEYMVGIINHGVADYVIEAGHKVAQLLIQKVETAKVVEVKKLSETKRGKGGFGSSGK